MSERETYARGVADGRALRKAGADSEALFCAGEGLYACGLAGGYFEFRLPEDFCRRAPWYARPAFPRDEEGTRCDVLPLGTLDNYKYVVILSFMGKEILLSRRRGRATWETQGGHIEPGESPEQAARRELFEESGARDCELSPLCDYFGYDDVSSAGGMVFTARVRALDALPESEMTEVRAFPALPENLSYPGITPALFQRAGGMIP